MAEKKLWRLSSLIIIAMLLISSCLIFDVEAEKKPELTYKAVNAKGETITSAKVGESFDVQVNFSENFNIFDMRVQYDTSLFEFVKEKSVFSDAVVSNGKEDGEYLINYSTSKEGGTKAAKGNLFTITLKAKSDAEVGKNGKIDLVVKDLDINDPEQDYKAVAIDYDLKNELENGFTVLEKDISKIAVTTLPAKQTYLEKKDQSLDLTGGKLTVTFADQSTKEVDMTNAAVSTSGYDCTKVGKQSIKVTYGSKTTEFDIQVQAKSAASLVVTSPTKTEYYQDSDETLDLTGGSLKVTYDNDDVETVALTDSRVTVSGFNNQTAGINTVEVVFGGKKETFELTIIAKAVVGISVNTLPKKTAYIEGQDASVLDLTGGTINIAYNNGKTEVLSMTDTKVSATGFDTSKVGKNEITLTFNDGSKDWKCTFDVIISVKGVQSIQVLQVPTAKQIEGKALDLTGGRFKVNYDNGKSEEKDMTVEGVSVSGYDINKTGKQKVTMNYGNKTADFEVTVNAKTVVSFVITAPAKKEYYQESDEQLDLTGGSLKVTYDNGTEEVVVLTDSRVKVSGFDNSQAGNNTITVEFGGKKETFNLTIIAKAVTGISVNTLPKKTDYIEGQDASVLDLTGGKIDVKYNNGKTQVVNMTDSKVSSFGFNTTTVGKNTVTLKYHDGNTDYMDSFDVTIKAKTVASVAIKTEPEKTTYIEGQALDLTNGKITVTYDNGKNEEKDMTAEGISVSGYNSKMIGSQEVVVYYGGKTCTFNVTVQAKTVSAIDLTKPTKIEYYQKSAETLDLSGGSLQVTYNNDDVETVALTDPRVTVSGFNNQTSGTNTVTVKFGDKTKTFDLTIKAEAVDKIAVRTTPAKKAYFVGDTLDLTDGTVSVIYNNGKSEELKMTDAKISSSGFDATSAGSKTVTLKYDNNEALTCTFNVTVSPNNVKSVGIETLPTTVGYIEGQNLNLSGGQLKVIYANGQSDTIDMTAGGVSVSRYDCNKIGKQRVLVAYGGQTASIDVTVSKKSVTNMELLTEPTKANYYQDSDEKFDPAGGKLRVTYNNGDTKEISLTDSRVKISGFDLQTPGTKTLTVTFGRKSVNFDININAKAITGIAVNSLPTKTGYIEGQGYSAFTLEGGKVNVMYNNGKTDVLDMTDAKIKSSGFDASKVGKNTVTLTYVGTEFKCSFDVAVSPKGVQTVELRKVPTQKTYLEGSPLNLSGGEIKVRYDNQKTEYIKMNDGRVSVSGYDSNKAGKQNVTVSFGGKTCTFDVNVQAKKVTGIEIKTEPSKLNYIAEQDENLDLTGGVLKVSYDNGTQAEIAMTEKGITVKGYDKAKDGVQIIAVEFGGKTTTNTFSVTVAPVEVKNTKVDSEPVSEVKKETYQKSVENTGIDDVAKAKVKELAEKVKVNSEKVLNTAQDLGIEAEKVKTVKEPVFSIELIEDESPAPEEGKLEKFTLEITPKVIVKVVDEDRPEETNKVIDEQEVDMSGTPVKISIDLPQAFQVTMTETRKAYVQHKGYEYIAYVDEKGTATFTSEHGCSPFTLSANSAAVVEIDGQRYADFEAALQDAKTNGKTIKLLQDVYHDFTAEEIGSGLTLKINHNGHQFDGRIPKGYTVSRTKAGNDTYTYTFAKEAAPDQPGENNADQQSNGTNVNTGIDNSATNGVMTVSIVLILTALAFAAILAVRKIRINRDQK